MQINPVVYSYKQDNKFEISPKEVYVGVLAQEIQKVLPEAVGSFADGYLSVKTDPIFWTMLNSIKEQQKQIEKQQKQIEELNAKYERILELINKK